MSVRSIGNKALKGLFCTAVAGTVALGATALTACDDDTPSHRAYTPTQKDEDLSDEAAMTLIIGGAAYAAALGLYGYGKMKGQW
jgi:hypothetical protein